MLGGTDKKKKGLALICYRTTLSRIMFYRLLLSDIYIYMYARFPSRPESLPGQNTLPCVVLHDASGWEKKKKANQKPRKTAVRARRGRTE